MKISRRVAAILMAVVFVVSLSGCGKSSDDKAKGQTDRIWDAITNLAVMPA